MNLKVLIVDDSKVVILAMKKLISTILPHFEIVSYSSPKDAILGISSDKHVFDLAFIDYNMEGLTGLELIKKLIELDASILNLKNTSLLSANIQQAVQQQAEDTGVSFLAKPMDEVKLKKYLDQCAIDYEQKN